jgi:16S rRNA (guanine527-N7)-methyltransferase
MSLTPEIIKIELQRYGVVADERLGRLIFTYVEMLLRWNSKISLTTITDPIDIVRFHFGESLIAAKSVPVEKGRLADVGSGAGFPGLPLHLLIPSLNTFLIEPNLKKVAFLSEVCRELSLSRVEVLRYRMEDLPVSYCNFDFVTARALGNHDALLCWSRNRLAPTGEVLLWLGKEDADHLAKTPDWQWRAAIEVPLAQRRVILPGSPGQS